MSDDEDSDARKDASKGDYGLSDGGWCLLEWLIRLWEKDAKEEAALQGMTGTIGLGIQGAGEFARLELLADAESPES